MQMSSVEFLEKSLAEERAEGEKYRAKIEKQWKEFDDLNERNDKLLEREKKYKMEIRKLKEEKRDLENKRCKAAESLKKLMDDINNEREQKRARRGDP